MAKQKNVLDAAALKQVTLAACNAADAKEDFSDVISARNELALAHQHYDRCLKAETDAVNVTIAAKIDYQAIEAKLHAALKKHGLLGR
jgi:hypothetical protein